MTSRRDWAFLIAALLFQGFLGLLGWGLAWWTAVPLAPQLRFNFPAIVWGLAVGVGAYLVVRLLFVLRLAPLLKLAEVVRTLVSNLFGKLPLVDIAAICAVTGLGEELLFRGFLQGWLGRMWGDAVGIVVSAALFGLAHCLTGLYALLAALFGLLLGWLAWWTENLWAAIVAHALYDFLAILYWRQSGKEPEATGEES